MTTADFTEIPTVDLGPVTGSAEDRSAEDRSAEDRSAEDRAELAQRLGTICHEIGFFTVVNHGIDPAFIASVFRMMEQFFALPEDQRALIDKRDSRHFRGWEAIGAESTNNRTDYRQQIDLWSEWPARRPTAEPAYLRLLGPNQWMPEDVMAGQRALVQDWFSQLAKLGNQLLGLLSVSLGLDELHLRSFFGEEPMSLTKLISYPPTPEGEAGVNAHHDTGFLTILAAGPTPGLQVQRPSGEWIHVPPNPDAFVINLGESLQSMTGNYFVATPHRVITREPRLSAGYFHGPSLDATLDPLPLDPSFARAVAASPRHAEAGYMAQRDETAAGVGAMQSTHRPHTYGEQLWNYFSRSYPENMELHYPEEANSAVH